MCLILTSDSSKSKVNKNRVKKVYTTGVKNNFKLFTNQFSVFI